MKNLFLAIAIVALPGAALAGETVSAALQTAGSLVGGVLTAGHPAGIVAGAVAGAAVHQTFQEVTQPPLQSAFPDSAPSVEALESTLGGLGIRNGISTSNGPGFGDAGLGGASGVPRPRNVQRL